MNDAQRVMTDNVAGRDTLAYRRFLMLNLAAGIGMLSLGMANFAVHARHEASVVWLPAGLAFGLMLLKGPKVLPGIVLGSGGCILVMTGDYLAATVFGMASGAACALASALIASWKPIEVHWLRVRTVGRILLAGVGSTMLAGVLLGPYAISELVKHPAAAPLPAASVVTDHGTQASANHAADMSRTAHAIGSGGHHPVGLIERLLMEAIGVVLVAPIVLQWGQRRREGATNLWRDVRPNALAAAAVLIAVAIAIYSGFIEDNFGIVHTTLLVLPPAVWLALEHGVAYTLLTNVAVSAITWAGTSLGHGPFKDHSSGLPILTLVFAVTALLIAASRSERKAAEKTIHRLATVDGLTGIPNRASFTTRLRDVLEDARRSPRTVAVMFIDLDNFKKINDTLGHQTGDQLLAEVARRMKECLRENAILARFGGDEFILMIDQVRDRSVLASIAHRLVHQISRPLVIDGHACQVSCSIGISQFPDDAPDVAELLMKADIAMYGVKAQGRNGHAFFSASEAHADESRRDQRGISDAAPVSSDLSGSLAKRTGT